MSGPLPNAKELEKLPIRALVAYAARNARRLCVGFSDLVPYDILEESLGLLDKVWKANQFGEIKPFMVIKASERVLEAYNSAPDEMKSKEKALLLFSLIQAALTSMYGLLAATDSANSRHQRECAAEAAQRTHGPIIALDSMVAGEAAKAARRDYELLLRQYGEHEDVVIGEVVNLIDSE